MALQLAWRTKRVVLTLAYLTLTLWCVLEWLSSRPSFFLNPLGFVAYFGSFIACLVFSTVLFLHSPRHRWLTEERLAGAALLLPLLWNLV